MEPRKRWSKRLSKTWTIEVNASSRTGWLCGDTICIYFAVYASGRVKYGIPGVIPQYVKDQVIDCCLEAAGDLGVELDI